jgi:hypothetical protein
MKTKNRTFKILIVLGICVSGFVTIGGLLGLPVFPNNQDDSKKSFVIGCYFIRTSLILRISRDRIQFKGSDSKYSMISDKMGIAILPTDLLRVEGSGSRPRVVKLQGRAELIPYVHNGLDFSTVDNVSLIVPKGVCPG